MERTRTAVIEAAAALMMDDGPGAVTHANVAAAAHVSRSTIYNHWPSREDLLRATIDSIRSHKPAVEDLTGVLRADLRTVLGPLIADLADDQRATMIVTMMQRALHDPAVVSVRDQFVTEFEGVFGQIVATAIAAGSLRPDVDPARSLASIVGSFLFIRYMSSTVFDEATADRVIDDFISLNAPS